MAETSFWLRVSKEKEKFTKKEKVLIEYISNNIQNMKNVTISQLKDDNNVGYSVIYNLIYRLNFKKYREFIISIVAEETSYKAQKNNNDVSSEKHHFIKEGYRRLLDLNDSTINFKKLEDLIIWIDKNYASTIYTVGNDETYLAASQLSWKLVSFGLNTFCLNKDDESFLMRCTLLKENDMLIVFSLSQLKESVIKAIQLAKENKAIVVVVTSQEISVLINFSDWVFSVVSSNLFETKQFLISPLIPMIYFNDLFASLFLKLENKDLYLNHSLKTNKVRKKINK